MAVKNILPSLQADEKSAQLHVRALPMPSMLGNAGALLSDAGKNIQGLGARLTLAIKAERDRQNEQASRIRQESDRLALNEKINAYRNSVYTLLDESMKLTGAEAVNSTKNFMDAVAKKREIASAGLNPNLLRAFNFEAEQIDFAARRNILNHEEKNLREANIQSRQLSIQNISANYARTGDPENMPQLYEAIEGLYRATYGDVPTDDTRITELLMTKDALEREGGKEEEIAKIDKELENLGMRTKAFYEMRDAIVEKMFSDRFDYLEKQGDLVGAHKFYLEHEDRLSEPTKNSMLKVLEDTERRKSNKDFAGVLVNYVVSAGGPDSMYWTPEMEEQRANLIEDLQRQAIDNPNAAEVLGFVKTFLTDRERAGKAKYAADMYVVTKDLEFNPSDPDGLARNVEKLQDAINRTSSPSLRLGLEELLAKYQNHLNTIAKSAVSGGGKDLKALHEMAENDPIHKRAVTMFMVAAATKGNNFHVSWGRGRYNLKNADDLASFRDATLLTYGPDGNVYGLFTEKEFEEFAKMVNSPTNTYVSQAAQDLLGVINKNSGSERKITEPQLIEYAPELIDQVLKWRALMAVDGNLKPDKLKELDDEMLLTIATQKVYFGWPWGSETFAKTIGNFFAGLEEGEIDLGKIRKHKATYEFNEQDEVRGELNKQILSVSTLPDARAFFSDDAPLEGAVKLIREGYDPSGQKVFDVGTNVWDMVKLPTEVEMSKTAVEAARRTAEAERAKDAKNKFPVVAPATIPGELPNNTYGFGARTRR